MPNELTQRIENLEFELSNLKDSYYKGNFAGSQAFTKPVTLVAGHIQSGNFATGASGWRMTAEGNLEANAGTFRGALLANSLDIPDTTTADSFHVDSTGNVWWGATAFANAIASISKAGNAVVSSLERNDFHWFTVFESIDGYSKGGSGTQTLNQDFVELATLATDASVSELQKIASYSKSFTWDKRRKIKLGLVFDTNTSQYMDLVTGGIAFAGNARKFGFRVRNGVVYALTDNGTGEDETAILTFATGTNYEFEARLNPGVSVEFYRDGILSATHTTSIPTGTADSNKLLDFYVRAQANAIKSVKITFYDFWQAN